MSICKYFSYEDFKGNLSPVRVISTSNIDGEYYNGPAGNGIDATLRMDADSLTIDGVVLNINDRILLVGQTKSYQNGIYFISCIDYDNFDLFLQRAPDQQSISQLKAGQFVVAVAGTQHMGNIFALVEPLPLYLGIDAINWITIANADLSPVILKNLGTWNADTNMTSGGTQLESSVGEEGGFYMVSVAGNTDLNGITDWEVQQMALFLGGSWLKYDFTKIYNFVSPLNLSDGNVSLQTNETLSVTTDNKLQVSLSGGVQLYQNLIQPDGNTKTCIDLGYYNGASWNATNYKDLKLPRFLSMYGDYWPVAERPPGSPTNAKYGCVILPYQVDADPHLAMIAINTNNGDFYIKWTAGNRNWVSANTNYYYSTAKTGVLEDLTTTAKNTLVAAINELKSNLGNLSSLTTTDKTNIVAAINELQLESGNLADLTTTDKTSLVAAINSLVTLINSISAQIPSSYQSPISLDSGTVLLKTNNSLGLTAVPDEELKVAVTYTAPISINESTQVVSLATDNSLTVINNQLQIPMGNALSIYSNLPISSTVTLPNAVDLSYYGGSQFNATNFKTMNRPAFVAMYNDFMDEDQRLPESGKYGAVILPYQTSADQHLAMLLINTESANMYIKWTAGNLNWGTNQYVQIYNTNQTGKLSDLQTSDKSSLVAAINSSLAPISETTLTGTLTQISGGNFIMQLYKIGKSVTAQMWFSSQPITLNWIGSPGCRYNQVIPSEFRPRSGTDGLRIPVTGTDMGTGAVVQMAEFTTGIDILQGVVELYMNYWSGKPNGNKSITMGAFTASWITN